MRTPVVISVVIWRITRRRAHGAERDHSIPEKGGTEGHHILLRTLYIRPYACFAPSDGVIARERECYRLLFLSVDIRLGSLQIVEPTGQGSVLCGADILSKELRERRILATSERAAQFTEV